MQELQLILEAINNLGEEASALLIWYFVIGLLKLIIGWGAAIGVIAILFKCGNNMIAICTGMTTLRDLLGIGRRGAMTQQELREVLAKVKEMKAKEEAE